MGTQRNVSQRTCRKVAVVSAVHQQVILIWKWHAAGEHLIQQTPVRPHITLPVVLVLFLGLNESRNLGRLVTNCSNIGVKRCVLRERAFAYTEITNLDSPSGFATNDEYVLDDISRGTRHLGPSTHVWLDITMYDIKVMHDLDAVQNLVANLFRALLINTIPNMVY